MFVLRGEITPDCGGCYSDDGAAVHAHAAVNSEAEADAAVVVVVREDLFELSRPWVYRGSRE